MLNALELGLHLLAQREIQSAQRLVEEKHPGLIDQRSGNGYPLLLTAREQIDIPRLKAPQPHQLEHLFDLDLALGCGNFFNLKPKLYILVDIQVWKQCVFLEYGVDIAFVGWQVVDAHALKNIILRGFWRSQPYPRVVVLPQPDGPKR